MKVVVTTDTTHNIDFIPRFYTTNTVVLTLRNEVNYEYIVVSNSFAEVDGEYTITFDYTFKENDRFEFTITDGSDIVYRGKLISTVQTPQQYKLTTDLYEE
jgi:hypothetical protein